MSHPHGHVKHKLCPFNVRAIANKEHLLGQYFKMHNFDIVLATETHTTQMKIAQLKIPKFRVTGASTRDCSNANVIAGKNGGGTAILIHNSIKSAPIPLDLLNVPSLGPIEASAVRIFFGNAPVVSKPKFSKIAKISKTLRHGTTGTRVMPPVSGVPPSGVKSFKNVIKLIGNHRASKDTNYGRVWKGIVDKNHPANRGGKRRALIAKTSIHPEFDTHSFIVVAIYISPSFSLKSSHLNELFSRIHNEFPKDTILFAGDFNPTGRENLIAAWTDENLLIELHGDGLKSREEQPPRFNVSLTRRICTPLPCTNLRYSFRPLFLR